MGSGEDRAVFMFKVMIMDHFIIYLYNVCFIVADFWQLEITLPFVVVMACIIFGALWKVGSIMDIKTAWRDTFTTGTGKIEKKSGNLICSSSYSASMEEIGEEFRNQTCLAIIYLDWFHCVKLYNFSNKPERLAY